jgi:hypothetical protein
MALALAVTTKVICGAPLAKSEQTLGEPADAEATASKAVFTNQYKCLTEIFRPIASDCQAGRDSGTITS